MSHAMLLGFADELLKILAARRASAPKARAGEQWTGAEDARLRAGASAGLDVADLGRALERSATAAYQRARRLGLRFPEGA